MKEPENKAPNQAVKGRGRPMKKADTAPPKDHEVAERILASLDRVHHRGT